MDGHGYITGYDRAAEQTWRRYGVALAPRASTGFPGPGNAINQTGVWEAIRRASHWLRWIDRSLFSGYAVEDGKSILWFSRYLTVSGVQVDVWAGLLDQITHDAPEKGWSNRWVLDVCLIPTVDSESSPWKPSAYSDIFALPDRCATCAYSYPPPGLEHANLSTRGQESNTVVEQPPGYRYIPLVEFSDTTQEWLNDGNLNDADSPDAPNFYRSCRIYEPPVEVESVELDGDEVKVTLTGRLHHAESAPAVIPRNILEWNQAEILSEGYRTIENGLRLYLIWQKPAIDTFDFYETGDIPEEPRNNGLRWPERWIAIHSPWYSLATDDFESYPLGEAGTLDGGDGWDEAWIILDLSGE